MNVHKKTLTELTISVANALSLIDAAMKEPSTVRRGKMIAHATNYLEMQNDSAMHFCLGYGFKKINNIKKSAV